MKRDLLPLLLLLGLLLACRSLFMDLNWNVGKSRSLFMDLNWTLGKSRSLFMDLYWNVGKSPTRWASISLCWGGG